MAERHGEPTRYLTFKLDKYAMYLKGPIRRVLNEIVNSKPDGITFDELRERAFIGPQHLRAILADLFDRDYIITNYQIAKLQETHGIDTQRLSSHSGAYPHRTPHGAQPYRPRKREEV